MVIEFFSPTQDGTVAREAITDFDPEAAACKGAKVRNAVEVALAELAVVKRTREAARGGMRSPEEELVGRWVEYWCPELNYPTGETVGARVAKYSAKRKMHLIVPHMLPGVVGPRQGTVPALLPRWVELAALPSQRVVPAEMSANEAGKRPEPEARRAIQAVGWTSEGVHPAACGLHSARMSSRPRLSCLRHPASFDGRVQPRVAEQIVPCDACRTMIMVPRPDVIVCCRCSYAWHYACLEVPVSRAAHADPWACPACVECTW